MSPTLVGPTMDAPGRGTAGGPLRSTRRAGLIEQVIDQLRDQITGGTWQVGSRIPTESELSQLTNTSRNTVREAVQSLVHSGLLERRQGSGTYVLAASELAGAVSRRIADARYVDVLEVRRTLEVGAARLAAERRTPQDVETLQRLVAGRIEARERGDVETTVQLDVELHRAIARAGQNPVLAELYENLVDALHENVRQSVVQNVEQHDSIPDGDHSELVRAIVDGDADRAAVQAACFIDTFLASSRSGTAD